MQLPNEEEAGAMHASTSSSSYSRQAAGSAMGTSGGAAHSPSRRFPTVSRSIPIAIRRNVSSTGGGDTTTSDEDDDDDQYDNNDNGRAMIGVGGGSSSKNGLLRAPYLGSLPSNAEFLLSNQHSMLLPAASLTRESAAATATAASYSAGMTTTGRTGYGSLRESNLMGRFMDGPSSYRERRTGGIVQLRNHRGRFDRGTTSSATSGAAETDAAAAASSMPSNPISIGDQIMMHARKRQDSSDSSRNEAQQPPASSLAAMLESSTLEDPSSVPGIMPGDFVAAASVLQAEDAPASVFGAVDSDEPDVISMSLTGLEVLHSLRNVRGSTSTSTSTSKVGFDASAQVVQQDLEHLPLDANGHNALLSRSTSDPTSQFRRLDQQYPVHLPTHERSPLPSNPPGPISTTTPGSFSTATFDSAPIDYDARRTLSATFAASSIPAGADASGPVWDDVMAPPAGNENPDTEGAFEMDLE
jgi:hypothetical protein